TGAGLIGLLTVQLLVAHGARVLAIDFDEAKLDLARQFGAETCNPARGEDPVAAGIAFSRGRGVDGVLITASTDSSDPVTQAARMCRKRGRIILVGVTGLELNRADFYEKELSFQVSCSYGPGRYDPAYEDKGQDYPLGFVRWTEQRNFEAVLDMLAAGRIDVEPLISHRFDFADATKAYDQLAEDKSVLGMLLDYGEPADERHVAKVVLDDRPLPAAGEPVVGFIGAGNYASRVLIPAFKDAGADLRTIVSAGGTSGVIHGRKNDFAEAGADTSALLADESINSVAIVTRHNSHASLTVDALNAGKHVFVEKPLGLTMSDIDAVEAAHAKTDRLLMVGFNRRFSPLTRKMKTLLDGVPEPKAFIMTMNAGAIPADHWSQDPEVGGGRIVGEACHLIDLMRYLTGAPITGVQASAMGGSANATLDKASIMLTFADGSFGTVHYLANGGSSFPKERIEAFAGGGTLQIDNFLKLRGYNWPGFKKMSLMRQDKGQGPCSKAFLDAVRAGSASPIAPEELFEVSRASIEAATLLK
ncbi:MAG: dehydrogenase, partial [Sphingomonadaceae bacterium]